MLTTERDQLQEQVELFADRRSHLVVQFNNTPEGAGRRELQSRMSELDARVARLDDQISRLNDRIAEAMGRSGSAPVIVDVPRVSAPQISIPPINFGRQRGPDPREVAGMMAAEAVLLALIGVVFWRLGMKRMRDQFDRMFASQGQQLNQLQQAVDTVAIEVERISEGQRYVAKVLSEGSPASALPGARKEPPPNRAGS